MFKIIGIGGCGNNILEFIKKQNLKQQDYEFISVKNDDEYQAIKFKEEDKVFTVSGLGRQTGTKYTKLIAQMAVKDNVEINNIVILPFKFESSSKKADADLKELLALHANVEAYANDDTSNDKDLKMSTIMRIYDQKIYEKIIDLTHMERL